MINWQAIEAVGAILSAFATTGAVVIALSPIWGERRRRNRQAVIVRTIIVDLLRELRPALTAETPDRFRTLQAAIVQLLPEAHVLDTPHFSAVAGIASGLHTFNDGPWPPEDVDAQPFIDRVAAIVRDLDIK